MRQRRRASLANLHAALCAAHFANGSRSRRHDTMQSIKRQHGRAVFLVFFLWLWPCHGTARQLLEFKPKRQLLVFSLAAGFAQSESG
jgi:hypothetical protein